MTNRKQNTNFEVLFLKEVCLIAEGNTYKDINISTISENLSLEQHADDYPPEILVNTVDALIQKNFIIFSNDFNIIRVTWTGIYYIIDLPGEIPTNYGVVSKTEIKEMYPHIIQKLQKLTENHGDIISVDELKQKTPNYGIGVIYQFLEFLRNKCIVTFLEEDELKTIKFNRDFYETTFN